MARPSSIDRLPPEIRERIGRLRDAGRTIDEILAALDALDVDVSRSALGRHVQKLDRIGERLRDRRALAEALMDRFGPQDDDKLARANLEMLHGILFDLTSGEDGEPVTFAPEQAMFLASAFRSLVTSQKSLTDLIEKGRAKALAEAAAALDDAARSAEAAGEKGLSAARIAQLRRDFLGIGRGPGAAP